MIAMSIASIAAAQLARNVASVELDRARSISPMISRAQDGEHWTAVMFVQARSVTSIGATESAGACG